MSRHARIELRVADLGWFDRGGELAALKPSARPHYLRLVAANGRIIAASGEGYSDRGECRTRGLTAANGWYADPKVVMP